MPKATTSTPRKPRRRVRYSVRFLAIVVALVAVYVASWEATKQYGIPDQDVFFGPEWPEEIRESEHRWAITSPDAFGESSSPVPFVIHTLETGDAFGSPVWKRYYIWFFGWHWRVYERKMTPRTRPLSLDRWTNTGLEEGATD